MILQELFKLYNRLSKDKEYQERLPLQGYSRQNISFIVVLKEDGTLYDIQDARISVKPSSGKKEVLRPREVIVCGSAHPSGTSATPRLLWDSSAYMLGYQKKENKKDAEKKIQRAVEILFPAYKKYHRDFMEKYALEGTHLKAVVKFLDNWDPHHISSEIQEKLDKYGDAFGLFKIQGHSEYVFENEQIRKAWEKDNKNAELPRGMCLVTGELDVPIVPIMDTKIKLVNSSVGGAVIASFNSRALESYGKTQTLNSPISEEASFKSCNALNILISDNRFHCNLLGTTIAYWTETKSVTEDLLSYVIQGKEPDENDTQDNTLLDRLKCFWKIVAKGGDPELITLGDSPETPFYMLGLEANMARVVIRFWYQSTLGEFIKRLHQHHEELRIDGMPAGKEHIPCWQILAQTARDLDDVPPLLGSAFLRSILQGTKYPLSLYQLVLNRINISHDKYKIGQKVNYVQAAILKACLIRNWKKGELTMSLNEELKTPAYLLGRLFATLEKTQDESSGGVNAGIGDKFYSSASATPKIVFPSLLDLFRKHLKKLSADKGGLAIAREKLVGEILDQFDPSVGFPTNLTLEERGLFALGYYQQMRKFFTKKETE